MGKTNSFIFGENQQPIAEVVFTDNPKDFLQRLQSKGYKIFKVFKKEKPTKIIYRLPPLILPSAPS